MTHPMKEVTEMHNTAPGQQGRSALPTASAKCDFPGCEQGAVTVTSMCELHRRVTVSGTGSWLEAG
jgi:hypothetical protein